MIPRWYTQKLVGPKAKHESVDDPQAAKVYAMEREIVGTSINMHMLPERLQEIASHACRKAKVEDCPVFVEASRERIFGETYADRVVLNSACHGDNIVVLLHELAHWITDRQYEDVTSHGPTFMRVYSGLLEQYRVLPRDCLAVLAARYGVEIGVE